MVGMVRRHMEHMGYGYPTLECIEHQGCDRQSFRTRARNIGATNVARTGSKGLAVATLVLDALKGWVAVAHVFHMAAHHPDHLPQLGAHTVYVLAALAALFAIIGHMFPVWLRFKGGKGV